MIVKLNKKITGVFFTLALITIAGSNSAFSQTGKIFQPDAKLEKLWGEGIFTEGVAAAPDGAIYFCDISIPDTPEKQAGHIFKFDPKTRQIMLFRSPSNQSNGMKFDAKGNMLTVQANFGGTRDILRTDMNTGKAYVYASRFNNKPFNSLNDLTIDNKGRLYVTDPRNLGDEPLEQPFFGVYRIDLDGTVKPIITDLLAPNGIAISPDQKTLYVSEHPYTCNDIVRYKCKFRAMSIKAYDLSDTGEATFRKTLVDYGETEGTDGMIVDAEGNIFAAVRDEKRKGIRVYSSEGLELDYIATPEKPTNVSFGKGTEKKVLYITAGKSLYRIATTKQGYELNK